MTSARLIASALLGASMLTGPVLIRNIGGSASCIERSQGYATCPRNPADRAVVAGWPMPSGGGRIQLLKAALTHLLFRHYAPVVEALARMRGAGGQFRLARRPCRPVPLIDRCGCPALAG